MHLPRWTYPLALALITLVVYLPSWQAGMLNYDDNRLILENPVVQSGSFSEVLSTFSGYTDNLYQPLTVVSWWLDQQLSGGSPAWFHATNGLLHAINTALVWLLVFRLTQRAPVALAVGLLFGLHPGHSEAVYWLSARKDLLFSLGYLAALCAYVAPNGSGRKWWAVYGWFLIALLAKPQALTLPVALLLVDGWRGQTLDRKALLEKLPLFVIAGIFGWLALQGYAVAVNPTLDSFRFGWWERGLLSGATLTELAVNQFIPYRLSPFHPFPGALAWWHAALCMAGLALTLLAFRSRKRLPDLWFGWLLFLVQIVPFLPIASTQVVGFLRADRYGYLASVGLYFLAAQLLYPVVQRHWTRWRIPCIAGATIGALAMTGATFQQAAVWNNSQAVWERITEQYPNNAWAYERLGATHNEQHNQGAALAAYQQAVVIDSANYVAWINRGITLYRMQDYRQSIEDFNRVLALAPDHVDALLNRGTAYSKMGSCDRATQDFSRAIALNPDDPKAYFQRGICLLNGQAYSAAIADFSAVLERQGNAALAHYNRGFAYHR
ncbi:MAG: tetratricopeptide repeat protein, partial [Bacteroidota bacterium]